MAIFKMSLIHYIPLDVQNTMQSTNYPNTIAPIFQRKVKLYVFLKQPFYFIETSPEKVLLAVELRLLNRFLNIYQNNHSLKGFAKLITEDK